MIPNVPLVHTGVPVWMWLGPVVAGATAVATWVARAEARWQAPKPAADAARSTRDLRPTASPTSAAA